MKGGLSYHGNTRNNTGIIDLSGESSEFNLKIFSSETENTTLVKYKSHASIFPEHKRKNSAVGSLALVSSAITFLAAKMLF